MGLGAAKNGKTGHLGFYDLRIEKYKIKIEDIKNLFGLLCFCKMSFLVPNCSKIL